MRKWVRGDDGAWLLYVDGRFERRERRSIFRPEEADHPHEQYLAMCREQFEKLPPMSR